MAGVKTDSLAFALYSSTAASTSNSAVTVSLAYASIAAGHTYAVDDVTVSWNGIAAAAIEAQLKDGSTVIDRFYLGQGSGGSHSKAYAHARKVVSGNDLVLTCSAAGTSVNVALSLGYHIVSL